MSEIEWEVVQTLGNSPANDGEHTSWEPFSVTGTGLSSLTSWRRRRLSDSEKKLRAEVIAARG